MNAVKFLKEANRMCNEDKCHECALENGPLCDLRSYFNGAPVGMTVEEIVKAVELWSEENPPMTNARKFREIFGIDPDAINWACRDWYEAEYKGE